MYLSSPRSPRRLRGWRGLRDASSDYVVGLVNPAAGAALATRDAWPYLTQVPNCSLSLLFSGNYLTCLTEKARAEAANAQVLSVPYNAAQAGYPPNVVAIAQQAAEQQIANTPADVANVSAAVENSQVGQSPLTYFGNLALNPNVQTPADPFDPSTWPTWAWIALAAGGAVVAWKVLK